MPLQIHILPILSDNYTYILTSNNDVAVVDPGEAQSVLTFLQQHNLSLKKILCTHHHHDHVAGNLELKQQTGCTIYGAAHDRHRIPGIDEVVEAGQTVKVGSSTATVIDSWGHTTGHISYFFSEEKKLFCGDSFFSGGCGRLFEGTPQHMLDTFCKFAKLDDATEVYCGHEYTRSNLRFAASIDMNNADLIAYQQQISGNQNRTIPSTIKREKQINPFMRCSDSQIRQALAMENAKDVEVFAKLRQLKDQS